MNSVFFSFFSFFLILNRKLISLSQFNSMLLVQPNQAHLTSCKTIHIFEVFEIGCKSQTCGQMGYSFRPDRAAMDLALHFKEPTIDSVINDSDKTRILMKMQLTP